MACRVARSPWNAVCRLAVAGYRQWARNLLPLVVSREASGVQAFVDSTTHELVDLAFDESYGLCVPGAVGWCFGSHLAGGAAAPRRIHTGRAFRLAPVPSINSATR